MRHRVAALAVLSTSVACTHVEHVHLHVDAAPAKLVTQSEPQLPLADPYDAVVRVASVHGECSGTIVGDRLVLTSRTCFDHLTKPTKLAEHDLRTRVGGGPVPWYVSRAVAVVLSPCHPLAVVVAESSLPARPLRMRLGAPPSPFEPVRVVGFGRCSSASHGHRAVGFAGLVRTLDDASFVLDAPSCTGDAGGPVVSDDTGEVVGVLTGVPLSGDGGGASSATGQAARVDVARGLLAQAFLVAHGVAPEHLPRAECP